MTEIIYQQDLIKVLNVSRQTFLRWKNDGKLPKPDIHLTQKCVGWKVSTLREAGINV